MKRSRQYGISLIELMVALAIFSILAAVAAPSIQELIKNNRARTLTNDFVSGLYQTRSEAVKRANTVTLCATNEAQTTCLKGAKDFSSGWMVFTDYNGNGRFNPNPKFDTTGDGIKDGKEEILHVSGQLPAGYSIKTTVNSNKLRKYLTYRSNGLPDMGNLMGMGYQLLDTSEEEATQLSRITIGLTGRIRSCVGGLDKCPKP